MNDDEIARRFWALAALLAPPCVPAWTPGALRLQQSLKQRAFKQAYKLEVSLRFAVDGQIELQVRLEPSPRVFGLPLPPTCATIAEALGRLSYAGRWNPDPGHAAANGTWRRSVRDLAAARDEVAFVQGLGRAMAVGESGRAKAKAGSAAGKTLSGWTLLDALRSRPVGALVPFSAEFERTARVPVENGHHEAKLHVSFLAGTLYKSASSSAGNGDAGRRMAEASVRALIGRAAGQWREGTEPSYSAYAALRSLDIAAKLVAATEGM